ncbi:MAG: hypothetical protein ACR2G7_03855 [Acidimicrobiales bacterium]
MNNRRPWPIYPIAGIIAGFAFAFTGLFAEHGAPVVALVVGAVFAVMGLVLPRLRADTEGDGRDPHRGRRRRS